MAAFAAGSKEGSKKLPTPTRKNSSSMMNAVNEAASIIDEGLKTIETKPKPKRKPSEYAIAYGEAFKEIADDYKRKNGSWKKDGFKRAQKAAHKKVKSGTKKGQVRKTARRAYEKK
jgi:hypothetical protein|tara:strand:- start:1279 stop:1626 length:348 start_codon:yes stop_codon:yes gene_type:complete